MLANRLGVLIAERQLSIKQISEDTGISRNTISNITNNIKANISTEIIDKLCNYLAVTPSEFFAYTPYSFGFIEKIDEQDQTSISVSTLINQREYVFDYALYFKKFDYEFTSKQRIDKYNMYINVENADGSNVDTGLLPIYEKIPLIFRNQLTNELVKSIFRVIKKYEHDIKVDVAHEDEPTEYISLKEYLSSLNSKNIDVSISLPWADISRKLKY